MRCLLRGPVLVAAAETVSREGVRSAAAKTHVQGASRGSGHRPQPGLMSVGGLGGILAPPSGRRAHMPPAR